MEALWELPGAGPKPGTKGEGHGKRNKDLIIGTWNTRSLHRAGALKEFTKVISDYNIDILAVQETRWTEKVSETRKHTILCNGNENRHELGVAFIVNNRMKENILDFRPIDERLCMLRIKTRFFNLSLINAHAETEEKDEIAKESFYQKLEQAHIWSRV
ncbi:craniofacial development protein 2-like protein [Lasius niger]|uniref:Craniofacial development protein 2-like protein n=1 Tax=Lasius niger TaxID=67767 RepID=A0A0J7KHP5_LASNI|nr:craniofacial development protein 2-like protein [Lasius niger]